MLSQRTEEYLRILSFSDLDRDSHVQLVVSNSWEIWPLSLN